MKLAIINKSDSTGGAAIVSRRLMEALRREGADACMLVAEKLSDSPHVVKAASDLAINYSFLAERLKIFTENGFDRSTLFKIDCASSGLPLWRHPLVKEADAIMLNWVNQGLLSLKGIDRILGLGKPVIWTMHDLWCATGLCHHPGSCMEFLHSCKDCKFLGRRAADPDFSTKVWERKLALYRRNPQLHFVAVSTWLADKCRDSALLGPAKISVIPNSFSPLLHSWQPGRGNDGKISDGKISGGKIRIAFGAARLDDPIKNLPALIAMTGALRKNYPELSSNMEIVTFGGIKDPRLFEQFELPHRHLGMVRGEENIMKVYEGADILVSSSSYETLPGTLVEAQAYGCIPVSFNRGGQGDIITHRLTGYLAEYADDTTVAGQRLAEGVAWAARCVADKEISDAIRGKMRKNVEERFSPHAVANCYLDLIREMRRGGS